MPEMNNYQNPVGKIERLKIVVFSGNDRNATKNCFTGKPSYSMFTFMLPSIHIFHSEHSSRLKIELVNHFESKFIY